MGWVRFCFGACGVGFVVLAFCGFDLVGGVVWGGFDWFFCGLDCDFRLLVWVVGLAALGLVSWVWWFWTCWLV